MIYKKIDLFEDALHKIGFKVGLESRELAIDIFKDGRCASGFLAKVIPIHFDYLIHTEKDQKGYDITHKFNNSKYEMRSIAKTKNPPLIESSNIGSGRTINQDIINYHINKWKDNKGDWRDDFLYILTDLRDLPNIEIFIMSIKELIYFNILSLNNNTNFGRLSDSKWNKFKKNYLLQTEKNNETIHC